MRDVLRLLTHQRSERSTADDFDPSDMYYLVCSLITLRRTYAPSGDVFLVWGDSVAMRLLVELKVTAEDVAAVLIDEISHSFGAKYARRQEIANAIQFFASSIDFGTYSSWIGNVLGSRTAIPEGRYCIKKNLRRAALASGVDRRQV
jgi:hypothetical protein